MATIYSGSATPTGELNITVLGTVQLAGAEISSYDAASKRFFVTSNGGLQIVDGSNPAAPALLTTIPTATLYIEGGDVTSVAVKNGIVAVAVANVTKTSPGRVVFVEAASGNILKSVAVGSLPDMVTFTPNGTKVLIANEGEPLTDAENGTIDPAGRISVIDITSGVGNATVANVGFSGFNAQQASLVAQGLRIDAGKLLSQAIEPEYIAVSADSSKAIITLQENNAFAMLDLTTNTITSIVPLGTKDHGIAVNAADFSDRDVPGSSNSGIINVQTAPGVRGMYMPDAIASYASGGKTYYVTANEGDAYDAFGSPTRADEVRVNAATLDPALVASIVNADPNDKYVTEADIKNNDNLGRLNVSTFGDTDKDGDLDQLLSYGGRSFSIWDENGTLVFDSGNVLERATAALVPGQFNSDGTSASFDTRSDNKGPEPEGVTVGSIGGKTYAFVGLERTGGIMAFDVTDPTNVSFSQYAFKSGDVAPEGVTFIDAASSPNGQNIVAVSNEVSGTLTLYQVDQPFTLQILHYYGESGLLGVDTAPIMGAMIDKMDDQYANTLVLSEGDMFIPGPWLIAGADPSLSAVPGIGSTALARPDVAIMNAFGTDASALGNHEFDLGSPVLQGAIQASGSWVGAQFPLITSNLDLSADSSLRGLSDKSLGGTSTNNFAGKEVTDIKGKIAPYAVVTQGGEKIGLVGLTTWELLTKSSPNGTRPLDDNDPTTSDLQEVAKYVQASVDALKSAGINKIVMIDQLDTLQRNKDLAPLVSGIDIMVAGGGHELMKDATDKVGSYPGHVDPASDAYPIVTAGADGKPVLIVTTDTEYSYLGRLVVQFNKAGELDVSKLDPAINGAYSADAATLQAVYGTADSAATIIGTSAIGSKVQAIVGAIDAVITAKDGNIFGYTNVYLEGDRVFGRTQEVNLGDISADANREAAAKALPQQEFIVSLKNGGGIRASIGSIDANGNKIPPLASDVKPAGAISQLDIENALRFDNKLIAFDTTAQGLLNIFNFAAGLSSGPNAQSGGYPQIGGMRVSYNSINPTGAKVENISLIDEDGNVIARVVENGVIVPDAPKTITIVSLNFTANGGDGYPIKANATNFRYLLSDGTLSKAVDPTLDLTAESTMQTVGQSLATVLGEQQAFKDFLKANHGTPATAYDVADTPAAQDVRIEILSQGATEKVMLGATVDGTTGNDKLAGTAGDDTINAGSGNDVLKASRGHDVMNGGEGEDTADFSSGVLTKQPAMLAGENGYTIKPLVTIGDVITGTTGDLNTKSAGNYQPAGILDGIGAYSKDASTVRVFVNSELGNTAGTSYQLENGVTLTGARIHYFDIDKMTKAVKDAGLAVGDMYDRSYNKVTAASQLDNPAGLGRFCSGSLYEANEFGTNKGVVDRIYFAGEESTNGTEWALDVATGDLWAVPMMGRGGWENVTQVDTGTTTHVAFLLGDDGPNGMPLYLYVGEKNAAGDFLDKNGLKNGKMYVWKADTAGVNSPAEFATGTQTGSWVEIAVRDAAKAGQSGYDAQGYKNETTLRAEADSLGAFSFSRPEDLSTNPANGKQIAFASTGASIVAGNTADGVADATDLWGFVYTMTLDFSASGAPVKGDMKIVYNGNTDATRALRSPDNLDWADDGFIYVNEDRSTNWAGAVAANPNEASIVKIDPASGTLTRVAEIDRGAIPFGQTDTNPADFGNWESSGILDVSKLFGEKGGSLFLTDVQAHSIAGANGGVGSLVEGGQLALIAAPGVTPAAPIAGVSINLGAGQATTIVGTPTGFFTKEAAMLDGENGFKATALVTIGDVITGTTGDLNTKSAGNYQPTGILDGIGAYSKDASTVRVFVNSELGNTAGTSYQLENGVTLTGARIHYFDIDKTTKAVKDAGLAVGDMYDRSYNKVTAASQLDNPAGLGRFCSGSLYEANEFGTNKGVVDRIYFAGEESTNGTEWALDVATGDLWAVPMMGRGGWENVTQVDTGTTTHVAFLLGDDGPNGMPLYLYVGEKNAAGDFLDKNGLKNGKMYVWKADTAGVNSPAEFATGTQTGSWVEIAVRDAAKAGQSGYDAQGYKNETTLRAEADSLGAFSFSRPEDLSTNPANGKQIAFASTGASIVAGNTADGVADATDLWGFVYTMTLDFSASGAPVKGDMKIVYNGNTDATRALRSPDNLDWADDGFIYVNEDRSTNWAGAVAANPNEASIVKIDPASGTLTRVAEIDRGAIPFGQTDTNPADFGNWESSGILDVSKLFGEKGGSLFLTDVQAHSIAGANGGVGSLVEGGQLVLLSAPGVQVSPSIEIDTLVSIENAVGTEAADQIVGNALANSLYAGGGDDSVSGGAGDDRIFGGDGKDYLAGDAGNDAVFAEAGDDYILGGAGDDSLDAGAGNDSVFGGDGNDYLIGGAGNDSMDGSAGNDIVFGGAGNNYVRGGAGNDQVDGGDGVDTVFGDDGDDIVRGNLGNDEVDGGAGSDTLFGDAGSDWLFGQADNDTLDGGEGNDVLFGGAGDDTLGGGAGSDSIIGGAGNDELRGGIDSDWFTFADAWGNDIIKDFEDGVDFINLTEVTGLTAFSQLTITQVGSNVQIALGGNAITIENTSTAQITQDDVLV